MDPIFFIFIIIIFIFSVIAHEISHGAMADYLGDPTAKYAGRLTLNPIKHLDPIGSILLPAFLFILTQATGVGIIFGWAKPVPINPFNFKDKKFGNLKVALAGPAANIVIALFFGLLMRFLPASFFISSSIVVIFTYITAINIMLALFNLLPIPPLDGSHILFTFLPSKYFGPVKVFLHQFGFMILLFFIYFASDWLYIALNWIFHLITGFSL